MLQATLCKANPNPELLRASTIPAELRQGVDAVIRLNKRSVEYHSPGRATIEVTRIITILNSNGLEHADFNLFYDSFRNYSNINGTIYDADGNRIRRLRSRDIDDRPASDGVSLIQDNRVKTFSLNHNEFPYTLEVSYRQNVTGFLNLTQWIPISSLRTSLEIGQLTVTLPASREIDFRMGNISDQFPFEEVNGNNRVLQWAVSNFPAVRTEPYGSRFIEYFPHVLITADEFSMDRRNGSMRSWDDFGKWMGQLWEGRNILPNDLKAYVDSVVEKHDNQKDIIAELYQYLQSNTRYVSIQLGIGGYQTETAMATIRNGYGDCKALTNYLYAMLQHAGIEAYPALIFSGNERIPFDPDFVHNQFNHAILFAVTDEGEEIWIESTSTNFPIGYIGESNANRMAVLFSTEFGRVVQTPQTNAADNVRGRLLEITLSSNGSATAHMQFEYRGSYHENIRFLERTLPGVRRREIQNQLPLRNYSLNNIDIISEEYQPISRLTAEMELNSIATIAGGRIFITPNLISRDIAQYAANPNRTQDVHIRRAYTESDLVTVHIPTGYRVEVIPEPTELTIDHGHYRMFVTVADDGKSFTYHREMVEERATLHAHRFENYRHFRHEAVRLDGAQVVLARIP